MRRGDCARAAATLGLALVCWTAPLPPSVGSLVGAGPALAEAGFYTRKRVNGRWVTGRFPKAETGGKVRRAKVRRPVEDDDDDVADIPLPPAREGDRPTVTASLPGSPGSPEPAPPVPIALALPEAAATPRLEEAPDERMVRLRRALQARADELAAQPMRGSVATDLAALASPAAPDLASAASTGKMDAALPPGLGFNPAPSTPTPPAAAPPAPIVSPKPAGLGPLEPKSVSYDFETGIKTTVFENSVVREPFDVAALRTIAGRVPQK